MNAYELHYPIIGKKLFILALEWSQGLPGTQKDRENQISGIRGRKRVINGSKSRKAAREAVEAAAADIIQARKSRNYPIHCVKPPVWSRSFDARLQRLIKDSLPLHGYRFDRNPKIAITRDPKDVGVYQTSELDWDYYSKSTKYPKKLVYTSITVPAAWRIRVLHQGLSVLDGLTTLDAQRLEGTPDGIALYSAVWLEQGRGYELRTVHGFIAIGLDQSYHADTQDKAMAGLRRKIGLKKDENALIDLLKHHNLDHFATQYPDLTVSVSDARAMGACEYGINSWCNQAGLDYENGFASLEMVYNAYKKYPLQEARAAILHALRRQKKAILKSVSYIKRLA